MNITYNLYLRPDYPEFYNTNVLIAFELYISSERDWSIWAPLTHDAFTVRALILIHLVMLFVLQAGRWRCHCWATLSSPMASLITRSDRCNSEHRWDFVESVRFNQSHTSLEMLSQSFSHEWPVVSKVPPTSLGGGGLFVPEGFEEGHHALPHVAAIALGVPWRHGNAAAAAAMEAGCEGRKGGGVHRICPFDLCWVHTPWLSPGRRSLSH